MKEKNKLTDSTEISCFKSFYLKLVGEITSALFRNFTGNDELFESSRSWKVWEFVEGELLLFIIIYWSCWYEMRIDSKYLMLFMLELEFYCFKLFVVEMFTLTHNNSNKFHIQRIFVKCFACLQCLNDSYNHFVFKIKL